MIAAAEHDYIQSYEEAAQALLDAPNNIRLQHQAALSLARAGALDFAISEYSRYGLGAVQDNEDVMALAGRLSKDLFLRSRDVQQAQDSARKYEAAYETTKGYYSGVNAATMALMADAPTCEITERATALLETLPAPEKLSATDHYFIEATRAECWLLTGNMDKAQEHLTAALAFDPLNYTAHASTLKQFNMILTKRGDRTDWLSNFTPPNSVHYAGHIHLEGPSKTQGDLTQTLIDEIQKHDIGFGYGALAAGSDILIAEALLSEGAELHVVLPCAESTFFETSVRPFGDTWETRYRHCLERARSLRTITYHTEWPNHHLTRLAGQLTMGQAILRAHDFNTQALQLLVWNGKTGASHTALHSADWAATGRQQIILPADTGRASEGAVLSASSGITSLMKSANMDVAAAFETITDAVKAALKQAAASPTESIALHIKIPGQESDDVLDRILAGGTPQSILMSDAFAQLLALESEGHFNVSFAGSVGQDQNTLLRCYALIA